MNNILFSGGGFPFENKTIDFMQNDYKSALSGIAGIGGMGNFIISGLIQTGSNVSEGWIYYNGELIFFEGGAKTDNFIIEETVENKIYQDGQTHPAYVTKHAKFGNGVTPIAFSTLRRLPNLLEMQSLITSIINFETSVIIDGCLRTNISTSPTTLTISAGLVMIDNNIISTQAYTGTYPVWINKDGQFVTVQPGTGSYIKFDPHTSQEKASVIRRAVYQPGDIIHKVVYNDRFNYSGSTGLGRWDMYGFALMNGANGTFDKRGRTGIHYDGRGSDPGGNVWDANYNAAGNVGGEKNHTLTVAETPAHTHGFDETHGESYLGSPTSATAGSGSNAPQTFPKTSGSSGGGLAHNNVQPYLIEVHAQRI